MLGSPRPAIDLAALSQGLIIPVRSISINFSHHQWGSSVLWHPSKTKNKKNKKKTCLHHLLLKSFREQSVAHRTGANSRHSKSSTSWPSPNLPALFLILIPSLKCPVLPSYGIPPYSKTRSCSPTPPSIHTCCSLDLLHC